MSEAKVEAKSDVKEFLERVHRDLDEYARLKKETPGSDKGWKRSGYSLMAEYMSKPTKLTGPRKTETEITYFGIQGLQGPAESAALDFCVAAHNLSLEDHLTTLLKMVEGVPEIKIKTYLPK